MKMRILMAIIARVYSDDHILEINALDCSCGIVNGNLRVKDKKTEVVIEREFESFESLVLWAGNHATYDEMRDDELDILRDEFAKEAMVGFINKMAGDTHQFTDENFDNIVNLSYSLADRMLVGKKKK